MLDVVIIDIVGLPKSHRDINNNQLPTTATTTKTATITTTKTTIVVCNYYNTLRQIIH
jgi:hypothetical protein